MSAQHSADILSRDHHRDRHDAADFPREKWFAWLALLFLCALLTRGWAVASHPVAPISDAADYQRLATGLASGRGYVSDAGDPTAWRPPGYPFFLAGVYSLIGGADVRAATYVQAVIGALTVLLIVVLGALVIDRKTGLIAGALAVVYPGFVWLPRVLLSENLSLPLLLVALCLTARLVRSISAPAWLGAPLGAALGLAALVRGANLIAGMLIVAGLAFVFARDRQSWRKGTVTLVLLVAGLGLTILPWTARNYIALGRFVPLATQEGMTLYASYWPPRVGSKLIWGNLPGPEDAEVAAAYQLSGEVETSRRLQRATWRRLAAEPSYFFKLWPAKLISAAAPFDWEWFPHRAGASRSTNVGYLLILVPALIGLFVSFKSRRLPRLWPLAVLPLSVLIQTLVFYGSPRFRLPAETSALLLAGIGLAWAWRLAFGPKRAPGDAVAQVE